jgi:hypothetical protein
MIVTFGGQDVTFGGQSIEFGPPEMPLASSDTKENKSADGKTDEEGEPVTS